MFMMAGFLAATLQVESPASDQRLGQIVARLGGDSAGDDYETLMQYRCAAVPPLARELRIVTPGHYFPEHQGFGTDHYLRVVEALRTITGRDFYGTVSRRQMARFSESARFFLEEYAPAGKVKPVAIWPSHGALYIAPVSAQREIIRQWRHYARSGACRWSGSRHHLQPNWSLTGDMNH